MRLPIAGEAGGPRREVLTALVLPDAVLARRALLLAAAYRLRACRRGPPMTGVEVLRRALNQALREAASGHSGAMRLLDSACATP